MFQQLVQATRAQVDTSEIPRVDAVFVLGAKAMATATEMGRCTDALRARLIQMGHIAPRLTQTPSLRVRFAVPSVRYNTL